MIVLQHTIYLDNSATTKPCDTAIKYINEALCTNWGNPSSLHNLGVNAECILNETREKISEILNCRDDEIFFTSGGTEANNICLIGAARQLKRRGNKIITTSIEHPSVLNTCKYLEENGFTVVKVSPDTNGKISAERIINEIDDDTILISLMYVNNEIGTILPIQQVSSYLKTIKSHALLHSDCVQAFGKLHIDVEALGVDLLSASAHKIHGPKGIGFLYKSKKVNIKPILFGGGQEKNLRSGTESVPLIAGLNGALSELNINNSFFTISELYNYAITKLNEIDSVVINSPKTNALPYILNISVLGYRSETMLHFLENKNIFVSSGSACSKGKGSYVLNEIGLEKSTIDSSLRISFSKNNTKDDINALCDAIKEIQATLKKR